MYDRVLVPTDGRESTERAIDEAIELAAENDATLHTLYVVNSAAIAPGIEFSDLEEIGRQAVEYVRDRARDAGVDAVDCEVLHGLRHRVILEYADDHGIDLIVLGRHRELDHLVRGSVSKRVSENASVPVMIVE
ncbi:universal stress protein [Natrinema ejinorense]|uniref:Universal stress protein UspA n=1 Tax=Natrinema ejinorense TaxID=373386 RepID=A0A2A5QQ42_9EURY|nr:universal stress protein [Natrinema ejinorense]PCR88976.1 universal stress protein UspA [Natrinema ejinorense]